MNNVPTDRPHDEDEQLFESLRCGLAGEPLTPDFDKLMAAARRRLAETLDPKTERERELVDWLGQELDLQGC